MLTTSRKQIVEKIICSNSGELFRVWFLVSIEGEKLCEAKMLRAISLGKIEDETKAIPSPYANLLLLEGKCPLSGIVLPKKNSKFFSDEFIPQDFSYLKVQRTRAPNR